MSFGWPRIDEASIAGEGAHPTGASLAELATPDLCWSFGSNDSMGGEFEDDIH